MTVDVTVPPDTDVSVDKTSLTFTVDNWNTTQTMTVNAAADDDAVVDEVVTLTHTVDGGDYGSNNVTADPVAVRITETDTPTLSIADESVDEDAGSVTFTVTLSTASSNEVTVDYATSNGTATAGSDYTEKTGTLTFPANSAAQQTFSVTVSDDAIDETDETFTVTLSSASNATLAGGEATLAATGTIEDDDERGAAVSPTALAVDEGASKPYTVVLTSQPTDDVTVDVTVPPDTDVSVDKTSLTFTAGNWETQQTVTVSASTDDDAAADAAVTLTHVVSGGDYAGESAAAVVVRITETGTATLSIEDERAAEAAGSVTFTVTLNAASSKIVTLGWSTADGTATAGEDYTAANGSLTFNPGDALSQTFSVAISDDAIDETDETFTVTLSNTSNATLAGGQPARAATGTIIDDDARGVRVTPTALRVDEGDSGTYTVVLAAQPTGVVTVTPARASGSANVTVSGALTFTASNWSAAQTVMLRTGQDADTENDAATIAHTVSGGDYGSVEASDVTVTVTDHDMPALSIADVRAAEDVGEMVFEVTLSTASGNEVRVEYGTADGTAQAGSDYTATNGTLTFVAGTTAAQEIRVPITDDAMDEAGEERFTVTLHSATNAALATGGMTPEATATIVDNDDAPTIRVSDARAVEGDAEIVFEVSLSRASAHPVMVLCGTVDGTAKAGEDYTAGEEVMAFEPGETTRVASVALLDDEMTEAEEFFTLVLSDPENAALASAGHSATGTITDDDNEAFTASSWLARYGRTVADHVVGAIDERLTGSRQGSHLTLGGRQLPLTPSGSSPYPAAHWELGGDPWAELDDARRVEGRQLMLQSSFLLAATAGDGVVEPGARWTAWGKAAATRFRGAAANLAIDGEVVTGTIGLDYERWRSLAGVALSHSGGTGTYPVRGGGGLPARLVDVESALTSVHPYVRLTLHDGLSAWGVLGYGQGHLSLIGEGPRLRTGIEMNMGALGVRGTLLSAPGARGFDVAVKSDVFMVRMKSDAADGLLPANVYVSRLRLGLEGSYRFAFGGGKSLAPSFEIGLRHDGGDAERGFGMEIGGGLTYASPTSGLKMELQGRVLLAHEASDFRDMGIAGRLHYATAPDSQLGPSLVLRSSWGGSAAGGVDVLWGGEAMAGLAHPHGAQGSRLDGEIAYGLRTLNGRAVGTPYAGMGLSNSGRDYRVGYRLGLARRTALNLELGLEGTRRDSAYANAPEHGIMLRATLGW